MKVAVYYSNDDVRIEERPVPRIKDGEILVRMMACGICGTDLMQWYRTQKAPRVLGHEMAGEIVETGSGVKGFRQGDRVFVSHHVPCYRCHYCIAGNYTACESLHTGNYDPGGFSEYIRVPEENVDFGTFILPAEMSYEDAAMIEPLACVVSGQKELGLKKGQTVLVIGSGISGLLHLQMAKLKGASVVATDISPYRLGKALAFGADRVFKAEEYSADRLKALNNGTLAERVIVCAGAKQALDHGISSVDRRGKILFFAVSESDLTIPSVRFWRDEIGIGFSYGASPEDIREAIRLIQNGMVDVRRMVTHRVPLSDILSGFKLASRGGESLKVIVVPDSTAESGQAGRDMYPESESPVDMEKALSLFDNDKEFFREMCRKFLDSVPQQVDKLSAAAMTGNAELVELYAHGIKGAASNLQAMKTCSLARCIEDRGRDGQITDVPLLIEDLRLELARLEHFVRTMK